MEILKEKIRVGRIEKPVSSQFAIEEDFNVPDSKADVGRVVASSGKMKIEEVKPLDSYLKVSGKLYVSILYVTDSSYPTLASMEAVLPVEEMIYVEEGSEGEYQLRISRIHINVGIIHSRKLEIKSVTEIILNRERTEMSEVTTAVEGGERVFQKKQTVEILQLMDSKRDIYRIKEEMKLSGTKENMEKIIWSEVELRRLDTKLATDQLLLNGEILVFCIYQTSEGNIQWTEHNLPFEGQMMCNGVDSSYYHHVYHNLQDTNVEIRMDEDGEMRIIGVDASLECKILVYKEEKKELLEDVYSLDEVCKVDSKYIFLEELIQQNHSKCKINERIALPEIRDEILQICHAGGEVQVEHMEWGKEGMQIEGILHLHFLYVKENDQIPFDLWSGMIPFSYTLECDGQGMNLQYDLTYALEQLAVELAGNGEVDVKAHLAFQSFLRKPINMEMISDVEGVPFDKKELESQAGIVGYIVKNGEDLWTLAKKYHTTEETIMKLNELQAKELKTGDKILIFKENMSIL